MRILWLDINSSYSHSSVALPAIHAQMEDAGRWEWTVIRGTINDKAGSLAAAVAESRPDIICSSFWLFTHQMQIEVLSRAVQLLDGVKVICGGPEFLGDNERFLRRHDFVTAVIRGEGEKALPELLSCIEEGKSWDGVAGLCWIDSASDEYRDNGSARVINFAELRFPEESPMFNWDKAFVQLETTRGCFNSCAFCVSGGEKPVRYQSLEQVAMRLKNIHAHGVKDVRVLDRTFNYDTERACRMLDLFAEYAGQMRFHLEIHPSLLSDALKAKIASLAKGLLHLEAGIQSLDSTVLSESGRKGSLKSSLEGLEFLCSLDNVETHADLIAGLPSYSIEMLCRDVVQLAEIGVDELQLESLKLLPGTKMRASAAEKGIIYSPLPPYEVLQTTHMSPSELGLAMRISRMLDFYYNCKVWQKVSRKLITKYPEFLLQFTEHLEEIMVLNSPLSIERRGAIIYDYCCEKHPEILTEISFAWIKAGFSLKKNPAGNTLRIKNIQEFIGEHKAYLEFEYGELVDSDRYYLLQSEQGDILFAYDSEFHQPSPSFMARIIKNN